MKTVAPSARKLKTIINTPKPEKEAELPPVATKPIVMNCEIIEKRSAPVVAA